VVLHPPSASGSWGLAPDWQSSLRPSSLTANGGKFVPNITCQGISHIFLADPHRYVWEREAEPLHSFSSSLRLE
jgi:hypothetical protein